MMPLASHASGVLLRRRMFFELQHDDKAARYIEIYINLLEKQGRFCYNKLDKAAAHRKGLWR